MNKNKFFERVGKLTFSVVLTGILVTGTLFAATTTWKTLTDNDPVSGQHWQDMVAIIWSKFNKADIPNCWVWEVVKSDGTSFSCVTDQEWWSTDLSSYYTKTQVDTKITWIWGISSCVIRDKLNSFGMWASVSCLAWEIMTGWWCDASMDAFNADIVTRSYPADSNTWKCEVWPWDSPRVYAVCCS